MREGHWLEHAPEYLIEAWGLGTFMVSAGFFGTLLEYPGSPVHQALPDATLRRALMGLAMGLTAIGLIYSPWGRQSGAHMNPATTLTFARLGKMQRRDAVFYVLAQFVGGVVGVALVLVALGSAFRDVPVRCVATFPGPAGTAMAFLAEMVMTLILLMVILHVSNNARLHRFTGLCAGVLVAVYITLEAPISGMSLNPARTLASALGRQGGSGSSPRAARHVARSAFL
jgi:aquaporin Z